MTAKRILIIDDDMELCEELSESLRAEGFDADYTTDPFKGECLIRNSQYDVVLLDYKMQELTGKDILRNLKADNIRKRIFLVTGRPSVEAILKEENLLDMVSGIISKPFNFEHILDKIKG